MTLIVAVVLLVPLSAGAEDKEFKIGLNLAFSGSAGAWGKIFSQGDQTVAEYYNSKGGLKIGSDTYKIVLVEADNKFTPEGATSAAQRLIEKDKVNLMHGAITTQDTLGSQEVTEPAKMISMNTGAADEVINAKDGKKYSYRAYISYTETFPAMMKWYMKRFPGKTRVALLDHNYDSAWRAHELMRKLSAKLGFEIVYDEYYEAGTKDFFPFLSKAMTKNPDLIMNLASPPPEYALRIKQARQLGFKGQFMECHPLEIDNMAPIAGAENLEGIIGYDYIIEGSGSNEKTIAFKKAYMDKYGKWDPFAMMSAAPLHALLMAFEKAGSLKSDAVIATITEDVKWETFTGLSGVFGGVSRYGRAAQWLTPQYMQIAVKGEAVPQLEDGEITIDEMLHGWD